MVPQLAEMHWTLIVATLSKQSGTIKHYGSRGRHTLPCYSCKYIQKMINRSRNRQFCWGQANPNLLSPKQDMFSNDCAVYISRTAELLIQKKNPLIEREEYQGNLRLHYLKRIILKCLQDEPDSRLQTALNPPERTSKEWMISKHAAPVLEPEEEVELVDANIRATSLQGVLAEHQLQNLPLFSREPTKWNEELQRMAETPYRNKPLGIAHAYQLLKFAAGLGAPQYLAELVSVVTYMRSRITTPHQSYDNDVFFYRLGKTAQENKLLASIHSRLVHQYYARKIEKRAMELKERGPPSRTTPVNSRNQENSGQALTRAVQEVAKGIVRGCYPQHNEPDEQILGEVQHTIREWRARGRVWVALGDRFNTQVIPLLVPRHMSFGPREDIRASDYEKLPAGLLPILVDAVVRLRPKLSEHFLGLATFYALLQDPSKLAAGTKLKIECVSKEEIEAEDLDSDVLTTLFTMAEPAKEVTETWSSAQSQISYLGNG